MLPNEKLNFQVDLPCSSLEMRLNEKYGVDIGLEAGTDRLHELPMWRACFSHANSRKPLEFCRYEDGIEGYTTYLHANVERTAFGEVYFRNHQAQHSSCCIVCL